MAWSLHGVILQPDRGQYYLTRVTISQALKCCLVVQQLFPALMEADDKNNGGPLQSMVTMDHYYHDFLEW